MKTSPLYRIYKIVWMAVRFFVVIFLFDRRHKVWDGEASDQWEKLLIKIAKEYKETAIQLEGMLIKVGQFLSTRADILPRVFLDELEGLVDHVPANGWESLRGTLEAGWGVPYGHYLQKISAEPVASASIGEVYHGYLHTGESVAIKIQRKDIEKIMKIDFRALRIVVWMLSHFSTFGKRFRLKALYRELVRVTSRELDFNRELENGMYFRKEFSSNDSVYVPQYYKEYSTKKVLVMEWIDGHKVNDQKFLKENHIDPKQLAETIFNCFAHQFLQSGRFHADPHPGNIFVRKDGTLVLLDFGMVSGIKKEDIIHFRKLVEGMVFENYDAVIDALKALGFLLPSANKREMEYAMKSVLDLYMSQNINGIDNELMEDILGDVMEIIRKQPIQLPGEFGFLGRAISVLVGLLYTINPSIDFLKTARPIVNEWIRGGENNQSYARLVFQYLKDWLKPVQQYPALVKESLEFPNRYLEWEREKSYHSYLHDAFSARIRYAAGSFFTGLIAFFISFLFGKWELAGGSAVFTILASVFYVVDHVRHRRWIQQLKGRKGEHSSV